MGRYSHTKSQQVIQQVMWAHDQLSITHYTLDCRLIIHNDKYNPLLTMVEEYKEQLKQFHPKLFVLGGLQMMDNFPYDDGIPF